LFKGVTNTLSPEEKTEAEEPMGYSVTNVAVCNRVRAEIDRRGFGQEVASLDDSCCSICAVFAIVTATQSWQFSASWQSEQHTPIGFLPERCCSALPEIGAL
jgi:hypothetical protein